jgi:hypothetical protein
LFPLKYFIWHTFLKKAQLILIGVVVICLLLSCNRSVKEQAVVPVPTSPLQAKPLAILQTGEHPLWFQLTEEGPVLLESIEDAMFSAALVPWPLALHIRFFQVQGDELTMAVNRDGFMRLSPNSGTAGLALCRFYGGGFWRQYTIGGFVFYEDKPAALLYLDDRFLDSSAPLPSPRAWTFNMESNIPFPLDIPALELFPAGEGWDIDYIRLAPDGFWYYRAGKRNAPQPEVRMLRTADLARAGNDVSLEDFQNSAPRNVEISPNPALPPLPKGFVYTGTGTVGGSLFASWEEQEDFNIGAAGFVLLTTNH